MSMSSMSTKGALKTHWEVAMERVRDLGRLARAFVPVILVAAMVLIAAPLYAQTATPIFVELKSPEPTVVARYQAAQQGKSFDENQHRAGIHLAQDQFLQELVAAGIPYTLTSTTLALPTGGLSVADRYTELINAVRLEVGGWNVGKIRRMTTVKHISVDVGKQIVLDHSVPYIRANGPNSARTMGLRGTGSINPNGSSTGQVVAVLDTGIHAGSAVGAGGGHPMFDDRVSDANFENRNFITNPDTRPVRSQGTPFIPGTHHTKVVYRALFGLNPVAGDDTGHGTMVASTAAGLKARTTLTDGSVVVEGVAPGALLMDYKVCPSLVCTDQQILLALEDSVKTADVVGFPKPVATVVNMSFGDEAGDPNEAIGTAAGNLQFAGVFPEASAGNSGPEENTVGSPAAHRLVVATAATLDPGVAPNSVDVLQANTVVRNTPGPAPNPGALPGTGTSFLAFFAPDSNSELGFTQPLAQYYVNVDLGDTPAQVPVEVNGRICLARRGSTVDAGVSGSGLFANKAAQCAAKGGIGLVVFNNTPGQIGVVLAPSSIPVFSISGTDGLFLRDTLGFESGMLGAISNFPIRLNPADPSLFVPDTAGFSSRGPNNDFRVVKPDITAPGTQILMGASPTGIPVILGDPDHYNSADGTSFSGPHLSGSAALVRDALARPNFTPSQVRAALMNGSTNLRNGDGTSIPDTDDNNLIHETGAGLADLVRAVNVKALTGTNSLNGTGGPDATTNPNFLPSHSFGERGLIGTGFPATASSQQRTITLTIADVSGKSGT
ncbi:MAG: S8 family serine peptidase, partial [Acidobacteria bacterium]|nr:S8 family serine peptidase [Acidobacteriota bacterium]